MSVRKRPSLPADLTDQQRDLYQRIAGGPRAEESAFPLTDEDGALNGPFDAMLLAPVIGDALQSVGSALRFGGRLSDRAREIAILLVAHHYASRFEIFAHEAVGRRIGLSENELTDLAVGRVPDSSDRHESETVAVVRRLLDHGSLDDEAYARAQDHLGEELIFEITTLVGYYSLLAMQLRVFGR
jgi:4-carboxymuconolactone decarboxylase